MEFLSPQIVSKSLNLFNFKDLLDATHDPFQFPSPSSLSGNCWLLVNSLSALLSPPCQASRGDKALRTDPDLQAGGFPLLVTSLVLYMLPGWILQPHETQN